WPRRPGRPAGGARRAAAGAVLLPTSDFLPDWSASETRTRRPLWPETATSCGRTGRLSLATWRGTRTAAGRETGHGTASLPAWNKAEGPTGEVGPSVLYAIRDSNPEPAD